MAAESVQRNPPGCYVYEIIVDGVVRYIGKGTGPRAKVHLRVARRINSARAEGAKIRTSDFYNGLAKALRNGASVTHTIIAEGLSSEEAFRREVASIASIPARQLWNEVPGGDGFSIESVSYPEAFRRKLKDGIARSWEDPARHERHSAASKARWENPEARVKQSMAVRAAWADKDLRKRHSEKMSKLQRSEKAVERNRSSAALRWARPGERARQGELSRAMQARRRAKKYANIFSGLLSFGT